MKLKNRYINIFAIPALMLAASCSSDNDPQEKPAQDESKEFVDLTFTVRPETSPMQSRVTNDGNGEISHIGKGEKLDMLIYVVYIQNPDGEFVLDPNYSGSITDYSDGRLAKAGYTSESQPSQYILPADFVASPTMDIEIPQMRVGETYKVAFWSQSSQAAKAYDTSDLDKVEVKYTDAEGNNFANNDETRDAFCQVWEATVSEDMANQQIILYRPLSQINVGTTGANYDNIMEGEGRFPLLKLTHSRISISGVARFLSVVDDRISGEELTNVTFDWAAMPAFMNMEEIPTDNAGLLQSEKEEFLHVDLNKDNFIEDYLVNYPTRAEDGTYLTETFKYLSMCYVLVPTGETGSGVLNSVKVGFAENPQGIDGLTTINLTTTPASRNHRTNILGGLYYVGTGTPEQPGDQENPENPEDPNNPNNPDNPEDPNNPDNPENPGEPGDPEPPVNDPSDVLQPQNILFVIDNNFSGRVDFTHEADDKWSINWWKPSV